jgi:hypothetical protein
MIWNLAIDQSRTIWMSAMDSELTHMEISKRMAEQEYKGNDPGHVTKQSQWWGQNVPGLLIRQMGGGKSKANWAKAQSKPKRWLEYTSSPNTVTGVR